MSDNYTIRLEVGCYRIIRSSESKNAMIHWNKPEYNEQSGRWYESCGCGFTSWRDAKYLQEADDLEMEEFRHAHPNAHVRESFMEVEYGTGYYDISRVWIFFSEYDGGKIRSNTLNLFDIAKEDLEVWLAAVWNWHDTGEFKTEHFSCYPCSGPWIEN